MVCWQRVTRRLRNNGHDVYSASLSGLGERVHLASPEVDLGTHITDVVKLIEFEDLHKVVLLGHSYGGLVVTGAADRISERISCLVYLDTAPLPGGGSLIEKFPPELRRRTEQQVQEVGEGWKFPIPPQEELAKMGVVPENKDAVISLSGWIHRCCGSSRLRRRRNRRRFPEGHAREAFGRSPLTIRRWHPQPNRGGTSTKGENR